MSEDRATRLKRLRMRSIRRGIKEMDLILGHYSEGLEGLSADELAGYELLLEENDHDLYAWVSGSAAPPPHLRALIAKISRATADKST